MAKKRGPARSGENLLRGSDDVVLAVNEIWSRGEVPTLREIGYLLGYAEGSVSTVWQRVHRAVLDGDLVSVTSARGNVTVWTPETLRAVRKVAKQLVIEDYEAIKHDDNQTA